MGILINGVIPKQTTKVKKQVMARVTIDENAENVTFLVLQGLSEEGILLGNDFLESHEAQINYSTQWIYLRFEGMEKIVKFKHDEYGRTLFKLSTHE